MQNYHSRNVWVGTEAERAAFTPTVNGTTFYCTDTKITYDWDGTAWIAPAGGAMTQHGNEYHTPDFMEGNQAITGATKTKITYDAKGLVTSGTDATTADIADSTGKRYTTEAQQTILSNTSGSNSGDASGHTALAPLDNPTFTTKITTPAITLGSTALTSTGTELNLLHGISTLSGSNTGDASGHSALATIDAPTFTGVPAAPTPAARTNTTQIATTAFVLGEGNSICLTSDFTTSSVTAVSTNLTFSIPANAVFAVDVYGTCKKATSATGLKFAIAAPSGCVIKGFQLGGGATLAAALVPSLITAINALGTTLATGTNIEVAFALHFRVVNSSTAGSITLQCATVTSNVATVFAGTKMIYNCASQV